MVQSVKMLNRDDLLEETLPDFAWSSLSISAKNKHRTFWQYHIFPPLSTGWNIEGEVVLFCYSPKA